MTELFILGLVCWITTLIIVEGVIFSEVRQWIRLNAHPKIAYLVTCQLCCGVWVGFLLAFFGGPFHGPVSLVLNGLAIKAVGHAILEATAMMKAATGRLNRGE